MNQIHPTAIVSPNAKLGDNNVIDKYTIIEDNVEIGNDCHIGPFAVLYPGARIKNRVKIMQSASVANVPQDLSFNKEDESVFIVDDDTTIREFVTLHRGTKSTGKSYVGKNCLIMAYSHVAHDDHVGNNCVIANSVQLAGHVNIEDFVTIGGGTVIHQFCNIGRNAMIGGGHKVTQDVPPFIIAADWPLNYKGINVIGLRRKGFSNDDIRLLKDTMALLYDKALNVTQAKEKINEKFGDNQYVKHLIEFLSNGKRGIIGK